MLDANQINAFEGWYDYRNNDTQILLNHVTEWPVLKLSRTENCIRQN